MPKGDQTGRSTAAAIRFDVVDSADAISAITAATAAIGGRIRTLATVRPIDGDPPLVEIELEVEGVSEDALVAAFGSLELAFEEHDPTGGLEPEAMTVGDLRPGAAGRGSL